MLPYGMKKRKNKIHPHNVCCICRSEPPTTNTTARKDAEKEINKELQDFYITKELSEE